MAQIPQIVRIIKMLEYFSMGRKLSSSDFHRIFEEKVSLRTIQRDINVILDAGIPLHCEQGFQKENVWSFPRDYRRMLPPVIHENEILSLYVLKSYLKEFRDTVIALNLESVIDKLEEMIPGDVFWDADSSFDVIWDQNYGAYDYREYNTLIEQLIEAIRSRGWLNISYKARNQQVAKAYRVFPHKLFSYHGTIYVAVYDPHYDKNLSFVLQRIQSLEKTEHPDSDIPDFDREKFRLDRFGVFEGDIVTVELKIAGQYAIYFANRTWHPSQELKALDNGDLHISMEVPLSPELISWILGWHEAITVLAPGELIAGIRQKLEDTLKLYDT